MLVAALRSDNPLGGVPLICDEAAESFTLQGLGEITAAKLLDLENRRQLIWADPVTREWVLETVALRVRRATAAKAAARAAQGRARADGVVHGGGGTLVFEPPRPAAALQPAGIRAAQIRFEAPADDAGGPRRVVWSELPSPTPVRRTTAVASAPAAASRDGALSTTLPGAAMATRRVDRRRSLKAAERHNALLSVRLAGAPAAVVLLLLAVLAVVALLVAAHGGF